MRSVLVVGICVTIMGATLLPALADEGRIPIYQPTTIASPGSYFLTRDISGGITISTGAVFLDLNGFTIRPTSGQPGVNILSSVGGTDIVVENGAIVGGGYGIRLVNETAPPQPRLTVRGLRVANCSTHGIWARGASAAIIEGNMVDDVGQVALVVESRYEASQVLVVGNHVRNADREGVFLGGVAGHVAENVIKQPCRTSTSCGGIYYFASSTGTDAGGVRIQQNVVESSGGHGIYIPSYGHAITLQENTARLNAGSGILLYGSGASVIGNNAYDNGAYGIQILGGEGTIVANNSVSFNGSHGIQNQAQRTAIDGNVITSNAGYGLYFSNPVEHVYRNNLVRNNASGSIYRYNPANIDGGGNICSGGCP